MGIIYSNFLMIITFRLYLTILFYRYWETVISGLVIISLYGCLRLRSRWNYYETYIISYRNLRYILILLAIYVSLLSLLLTIRRQSPLYRNTINVLTLVIICCFRTNNLFFFYLYFEISLIPILYIIIAWGYQPERLQAGTYLILYTVCASLPLLISILVINNNYQTLSLHILKCSGIVINNWILMLTLFLALLVKMPIYIGHLWLPKAHVEAPLAGSIILAGLLLKLGGYGIYLIFQLFIFPISPLLLAITRGGLWGGVIAAFLCINQVDIKAYVAYTSVAHISLVIRGLIINNLWGIIAAKITMFAHGFTSSILFAIAALTYNLSGSRRLVINKGLLSFYPVLSLIWFRRLILCIAAPPSINLLGELIFVPRFAEYRFGLVGVLGVLIFFGAVYSMYLYSSLCHGSPNKLLLPTLETTSINYLGIIIHFLPLLLIFNIHYFLIYSVVYYSWEGNKLTCEYFCFTKAKFYLNYYCRHLISKF